MPSHEWTYRRGSGQKEMIVRIHSCLAVNALPETRGLLLNLNKPIAPRLTVRVEFDGDRLVGYQVYVEGWTLKGEHIVSQCVGYETVPSRFNTARMVPSLDGLPSFLAPLVAMMRIRKRSIENKAYWSNSMLWLHDVEVTTNDLTELTGREKWKYEINGEVIVGKIMQMIPDVENTEGSDSMRLCTDQKHLASSKHPVATVAI